MKADLVRSMAAACRHLEEANAQLSEYTSRAVDACDTQLLWPCVVWQTTVGTLMVLATTLRDTIAAADCLHDEHLN